MSGTPETSVDIKDYIITGKIEKKAPVAEYSVILENNTDFIISRKTAKTERELVILISQNLYYLKDKKTEKIEDVSPESLKSYFRDLKEGLPLKSVNWIETLDKECYPRINRIISDESLSDMCRHNLIDSKLTDPSRLQVFWVQNGKLLIRLHELFPSLSEPNKYMPSLKLIFKMDEVYGYNEALHFASQLAKSSIQYFSDRRSYHYDDYDNSLSPENFIGLVQKKEYNLQLRRLTDYLLFDLYKQGVTSIDSITLKDYEDYLKMQVDYYGRVREKYPKYFQTEHDVMSMKVQIIKDAQEIESFSTQIKNASDLAYSGKVYSIIIPKTPQDLTDEGINLCHCVGAYVKRVADGECYVLFMRRTNAITHSLVTVQVSGKTVNMAQGMKRRRVSSEERQFLHLWGAKKGLIVRV